MNSTETTTEYSYEIIGGVPARAYWTIQALTVIQPYIEPIFIFPALVFNSVIIVVYLQPAAVKQCGGTTRVYYVVMAISELVNTVTYHLLVSWIDLGFQRASKGAFFISLLRSTVLGCQLLKYIYNLAEQTNAFTLALFSLERCIALYLPLKARVVYSPRRAYWALGLTTLALALLNIVLPVTSTVRYTAGTGLEGASCYAVITSVGENVVHNVTRFFMSFDVPWLIILVLNLMIIAKILRSRNWRLGKNADLKSSTKEMNAVVTLLTITLIHCIFYFPTGVTSLINGLFEMNLVHMKTVAQSIMVNLSFIFLALTVVTRIMNFFVYFARVPYFRKQVLYPFRLCCKSHSNNN